MFGIGRRVYERQEFAGRMLSIGWRDYTKFVWGVRGWLRGG